MNRGLLGIVRVGAHRELAARERGDVVRDAAHRALPAAVVSSTTRSCRHSRSTNPIAPAAQLRDACGRRRSTGRSRAAARSANSTRSVSVCARLISAAAAPGGRRSSTAIAVGTGTGTHRSAAGSVKSSAPDVGVLGVEHDRGVTRHRAAEQLHEGVLLDGGKSGDPGGVRRLADRAAVREIRRLAPPAAEPQAGSVHELEQLGHGVGAVARVAQRVSERVVVGEVARLAQQPAQWMPERDLPQRRHQVAELAGRRADPEPAAVVLEHVHAGASVARVHHQRHGSARRQDLAQPAQAERGIGEVMEDAGAHDVIEPLAELVDLSIGTWWSSRLATSWRAASARACSRLSALTSIPTTRTSGRRSAWRTAWEVPQPATSTDRTEPIGRAGQIAWWAARTAPSSGLRANASGR